ncbi:MAG: hypothetical protein GY953_41550, partial [bacterium]|nr:hypothetical protein [bacterium]
PWRKLLAAAAVFAFASTIALRFTAFDREQSLSYEVETVGMSQAKRESRETDTDYDVSLLPAPTSTPAVPGEKNGRGENEIFIPGYRGTTSFENSPTSADDLFDSRGREFLGGADSIEGYSYREVTDDAEGEVPTDLGWATAAGSVPGADSPLGTATGGGLGFGGGSGRVFGSGGTVGNGNTAPDGFAFVQPGGNTPIPSDGFPVTSGLRFGLDGQQQKKLDTMEEEQ